MVAQRTGELAADRLDAVEPERAAVAAEFVSSG